MVPPTQTWGWLDKDEARATMTWKTRGGGVFDVFTCTHASIGEALS